MDWQAILDSLTAWATTAGVRLLVAFAVLFISFRIVNRIARRIERSGNRQNADKTIMRTMAYAFKVGMKLVILV
ncbi:MAG: hypothetical protein IKT72_05100, partial [Clostridia bacterium]|nr:hypothetical protein [Clostridia bacterium]